LFLFFKIPPLPGPEIKGRQADVCLPHPAEVVTGYNVNKI
jgi:hypothetical protein